MYGMFHKARASDVKVFHTIGKKYESEPGKNDGWDVLQRRIVDFQEDAAIKAKNSLS